MYVGLYIARTHQRHRSRQHAAPLLVPYKLKAGIVLLLHLLVQTVFQNVFHSCVHVLVQLHLVVGR